MSQKKKYKLKRKRITIVLLCTILLLGGLSIFIYNYYSSNILKEIKKNYNEYIITTKKTNLYNKHKKQVGTISSDYYLELDKISNITIKNKYLKIKNSPYYISYKNIKKTNKRDLKKETNDSYYLDINKELSTNKKVKLLKDNKTIITLNGITTNIKRIDDNYYYVDFFNESFTIKKDKSMKVKDLKDDNNKNNVTVILYDEINTNCSSDTCFNPNSIKAHIDRIKKAGNYFITLEDYLYYLKDYINLKEKAVLLVTKEDNEFTKKIEEETKVKISSLKDHSDLKFTNNNKQSTKNDKTTNISNYYPKKYFIIDKYLEMAEGKDVKDDGPSSVATEIPVVNYHFFYDSTNENCNESICLDTKKFEEQLKWLKDNNYKTLTINEFADWKDGYIELPEHSVLLTIDDGAMGTGKHNGNKLIPLLEKYEEHATLFLITGWWSLDNYQSKYLDVQSHTHNLHFEARCPDGRGKVACSDYKTVKADLEQSLKVLGDDKTSFCFPFYSYDRESLQALRELGFRVAFIGGNTRAKRSQDNLLVTRYPILSDITLNHFINLVK